MTSVSSTGQPYTVPRGRSRRARQVRQLGVIFLLLGPAIALRLFTAFYPYVQSIRLSLYDYNPAFPPMEWVGLENYSRAVDDVAIRASLSFTLIFVSVSTILEIVFGLAIALMLNQAFRGRSIVRAVSLVPWAIPMVVVAIGFRWLFDVQYGLYNDLLRRTLGFDVTWLLDFWPARIAVIWCNVWKSTPFLGLVFLASLQALPGEVMEAARVDGAGRVRSFFSVTLPLILPQIVTISLFMLVWQLAAFDLIYAMTGGGPGYATQVLAYSIYQVAFSGLNYGYASAISLILFLVVAVVTGFVLILYRQVEVTI